MNVTFQSASSTGYFETDLRDLFESNQSLPKDIKSVIGFTTSIGGKTPAIEKREDGTIIGARSAELARVEVRFVFDGLATVRPRNVVLAGKTQWEKMYRVLVRLIPKLRNTPFKVDNMAVRFYLKKTVRMQHVFDQYRKRRDLPYTMFYEPEIFARLEIRFRGGQLAYVFFNGTVTAQGADLSGIDVNIKAILDSYKDPYGVDVPVTPIPARKNLKAKREHMASVRYDAANSWNAVRNGHYVRPGPNKVPRFYKVPDNPAYVRQKVLRAYQDIGIAVPVNTAQKLGISENIKLKNKKVPISGEGTYLRPGPAGILKAYKIPKDLKLGKKTAIKAYADAGIDIPENVRSLFGIEAQSSLPVARKVGANVHEGTFRIGGLDCSRYTLKNLQKIATNVDMAHTGVKKPVLCNLLKNRLNPNASTSARDENFTIDGTNYIILPNERKLQRKGTSRSRALDSFKLSELKRFIQAYNPSLEMNGTKKILIQRLITEKLDTNAFNANLVAAVQKPQSPPKEGPLNRLGPGFTPDEQTKFTRQVQKGKKTEENIINKFHNKFRTILGNKTVSRENLKVFQTMYASGATVKNFHTLKLRSYGVPEKFHPEMLIFMARNPTKPQIQAEINKLQKREKLRARLAKPQKVSLVKVPVELM
jgi:hypothetical protein